MQATRRRFLHGVLTATAAPALLPRSVRAQVDPPATKPIPSTGEAIPAVGLGSWITFNVGDDPVLRDECAAVMRRLLRGGRPHDRLVADVRLVAGRHRLRAREARPSAGAVFGRQGLDSSGAAGREQIESPRATGACRGSTSCRCTICVAWEEHLQTLFAMKAAGELRYVGITTSEGRRHDVIERIMRTAAARFRPGHLQHRSTGRSSSASCRWPATAASP